MIQERLPIGGAFVIRVKIKKLAKNRMENMVEKYKQEKHRFETEMLEMVRARDHAQAGYQRIKKQLEKRKRLNVNQL